LSSVGSPVAPLAASSSTWWSTSSESLTTISIAPHDERSGGIVAVLRKPPHANA